MSAPAIRCGSGGGEASGSRRAYEVLDLDAQPTRELAQHTHARVALASLDAPHVGKRETGGVGDLFLSEAALGSQAADVGSEAGDRFVGGHPVILFQ
jgi:hypothetical protein